jgi:hypothetical protein
LSESHCDDGQYEREPLHALSVSDMAEGRVAKASWSDQEGLRPFFEELAAYGP